MPTDTQNEIRSVAQKLCDQFGVDYWRKCDERPAYPEEFVAAMAGAGWLAALIPEQYGGAGLGVIEGCVILEEINRPGGNGAACHAQMCTMASLLTSIVLTAPRHTALARERDMPAGLAFRSIHVEPEARSATRRIADFVTTADPGQAVRGLALEAVLDTLAVTIAGGAEESVQRLARSLDAASADDSIPSLWRLTAYRRDDAALLLGVASHVLDYDDVSMLAVCHPTAPVLSACLCVPGRDRISGAGLLDAVAIGTEVMIRLGEVMGFRHYDLGFHATATLGTVGAASACARLMRLDRPQVTNAISIAASMSSGLRTNFGSMVKSLHVGIAAANGLRAAQLAAAGIEASPEALDGSGFLKAFSGGATDQWPEDHRLGTPYVLEEPGFERKRYPCCYMLHKMIEGALGLARDERVGLSDLARARVDMPQGGTRPLIHPYPRIGMNALFSAPYAVIASLADKQIGLASFTDAAVGRPEIQARLRDVHVAESVAPSRDGDLGNAPVTVALTLRNGAQLKWTVVAPPGSSRDPLTVEQLQGKWTDCLRHGAPHVSRSDAASLFEDGKRLASLPRLGPWLAALRLRTAAPDRAP